MTAFTEMIDEIYADPDFALDAVYRPQAGAPVNIRVRKREPDALAGGQLGRAVVAALGFAVRQSEVPNRPRRGDSIEQAETADGPAAIYDVEEASADAERLEWILGVTKRKV